MPPALRRPSLLVLALLVSVGPFSDTEIAPAIPRMADSLHASYDAAQLTVTTYLVGYALAQLAYGPLSDRFGRRPLVLAGVALLLVASILGALSVTLPMLLAARLVQGLGAAAGGVIVFAAIRDAWSEDERAPAYARINVAYALAPGAGPLVGGFLGPHVGWRAAMLAVVVVAAVTLVVALRAFPETLRPRVRDSGTPGSILASVAHDARALLGHRGFRIYAAIAGACVGIIYACLSEAAALSRILGMFSFGFFALVAAAIAGAYAAGSLLGANLVHRHVSGDVVSRAGLVVVAVSAALLTVVALTDRVSLVTTLVPIMLVFAGLALVVPQVTAGAMAPFGEIAGAASAMLGAVEMGTASLATLTTSVVPLPPATTMAVVFLALSTAALASHLIFLRPRGA